MAKNALMTDPYAVLRNLPANAFYRQPGFNDSRQILVGNQEVGATETEEFWNPGGALSFDVGMPDLRGTPFHSKYGGRLVDLGGGRVGMTVQQPGAHKYDTMQAVYAQDPSGQWVLQGDPMDSKTREVSSGEEFRDNAELAGKGVLAAGALYAAGLGLSSGIGALAGGSSAGAGAAASNPAVWNAALAESAVGTGGYGASSAGLGGGAAASWGAGAGYGADAAAALPEGSFWGDIGGQSLPQDFGGFENVGARADAATVGGYGPGMSGAETGIYDAGIKAGGNGLLSGIGDFFSGNSSLDTYLRTGQLLGGLYAQNKSNGAVQAGNNAQNALLAQMYQQNRADNQPLLDMRNSVLPQIQGLLKDPSTITQQPGYQFGLKQGTNQLNNRAAASGNYYSGAQMKAAQQFGQDYAGTKLDQSLNRLTNVAGLGQVGANNNQSNNTNFGVSGGNALAQGGNIRGSGYLGSFNTANNAANGWMQDDIWNRLLKGNGG